MRYAATRDDYMALDSEAFRPADYVSKVVRDEDAAAAVDAPVEENH